MRFDQDSHPLLWALTTDLLGALHTAVMWLPTIVVAVLVWKVLG